MGYTSLLVHTVDNNIDNIEILLIEKNFETDVRNIISEIIKEQMNKILENAELYYLEDDCYAKNKDVVFLLEYIYLIQCWKKMKKQKTFILLFQQYTKIKK